MRLFLLIFLLFTLVVPELCAQEMAVFGARSAGLANTSSTIEDAYSAFNNIAATASLKGVHFASTIENRFGLKSLSTIGFASSLETKFGVPSISFSKYGDRYFSAQTIGLGAAHSLDNILLGFKVNYHQINIEETMSRRNILANFGGMIKFSRSVIFAAQVSNFRISQISKEKYHVPVILKSGFSYKPGPHLIINIEAEKNIQYKGIVKLGAEYTIANILMIRSGTTSQNFSPHFGAGFKHKNFQMDYALSSTYLLGAIHQVSFSYRIARN